MASASLVDAQPLQTITSSSFETVSQGDYGPTNTIFTNSLGTNLEGWIVAANNEAVVRSNDLYRANTGTNFLALANGELTNQITTFIGQPYTMRFAYRGPGLVDWWPLDGNVNDVIGTNNGTITPTLSSVTGVVGQAFQFDGVNSQIDFGPTAGNVGSNDFTIDYWMSTTNPLPQAFLAKRAVCGLGSSLDITVGYPYNGSTVPGVLTFGLRDEGTAGGVGPCACFTSNALNNGQWHHVAWVRRANPGRSTANVLVYVDGRLNNTSNNQPITCVTNSTHLIMGQNVCVGVDGTTAYKGMADELDIWNRALSDVEIAAIYQAGLKGVGKATTTSILPNCQILVNGLTNATLIAPASSTNWLTNTVSFTALSNSATVAIRGNPMGLLFDDFVLLTPLAVTVQPQSQTNYVGATVTFSVSTTSLYPTGYQWQRNETNLTDGGNISGATNSTLTLTGISHPDAASYSVIVSNAAGSVSSSNATLTVNDLLFFVMQPLSQTVGVGSTVTFAAEVGGVPPFVFQWSFNRAPVGSPAAGTNFSSITLTNVGTNQAGNCTVEVFNGSGSLTSSNAVLTVIPQPTLALQILAGYPLLTLNGILSNNFVVQYSTNLARTNWINLLSMTNFSSSSYEFLDPSGVSQPARFYRAFFRQ